MGRFFLSVRGRDAGAFVDALVTCRVMTMRPGGVRAGLMLDDEGGVIDTVGIRYAGRRGDGATGPDEEEFVMFCRRGAKVRSWLQAVLAGKATLDARDGEARLEGQVTVEEAGADKALVVEEADINAAGAAALVDVAKPFFVGQRAIYGKFPARTLREWKPPHIERRKPLPKTILGDIHGEVGVSQWGEFGSATMPIQYAAGPGAIAQEHLATRCGAALYDVSHMLPIIVKGRDARAFLEMCLVGRAARVAAGRCQYQGMCLPDGTPLDDLYLNYLERDSTTGEDAYLLVGNSGHEGDYYFLKAVAAGEAMIDPEMPAKRFEGQVEFISRLEEGQGRGRWGQPLHSISIQGPKSREILLGAIAGESRERVEALVFNELATGVRLRNGGGELVVTFTGYCGEPVGYEVYATREDLPRVWLALQAGGAAPAGLGARDSTRQEAGLPLFGHEIDGALGIAFSGGRYPKMVSWRKPFFVGKRGAFEVERRRTKRVFLLAADGPRKVSAGWPVYGGEGELLGYVTSTSTIRPGRTDATQAYLEEGSVKLGDRVVITSPSRTPKPGGRVEGRVFEISTWEKARDYKC